MKTALAGGVNMILLPNGNIFFSKAGALSPDGRCKTFDHRANGIVRSEGAGILVLKPLKRAIADGDRIRAVIHGSAINQDGRSNGLMAPNGLAQEALLRQAYGNAGVDPASVQFVETHGTGTILGDPIEVNALGAVLAEGRPAALPKVRLGAVKTNLGHLEAAAGVAGTIKTVLAMEHRRLPKNLHFEEANPLIPFQDLPLQAQADDTPWPMDGSPLIAGVSGFGFGGTNAHLVLGEAPRRDRGAKVPDGDPRLLVFSARSPDGLKPLAERYRELLAAPAGKDSPSLADLCAAAALHRDHFEHRLALVAQDRAQAVERLDQWLADEKPAGVPSAVVGRSLPAMQLKTAFVFSGQGSHWLGMGRHLMVTEPVFHTALERCEQQLRDLVDWSLLDQLGAEEADSELDRTEIAQPAIFAIQISLVVLLRTWGIVPQAVVGQSLGEIAAAHAAGILTLHDALKVVVERSRLMALPEAAGRTALVGLPREAAAERLQASGLAVTVAGVNSPGFTVISGDTDDVQTLVEQFEQEGLYCRLLKGVEIAFHSPRLEPLAKELESALEGIEPRSARLPFISSVTGGELDGETLTPEYWGRNLFQPFAFDEAFKELVDRRFQTLLEISPHGVLVGPMRQSLEQWQVSANVIATQSRGRDDRESCLQAMAELYALGHTPQWRALFPQRPMPLDLPAYPWQRDAYWIDQVPTQGFLTSRAALPEGYATTRDGHPLLGAYVNPSHTPDRHYWQLELSSAAFPMLEEHRIEGMIVVPGALFVEMALAGAKRLLGDQPLVLEDLVLTEALILRTDQAQTVQLELSGAGSQTLELRIRSRSQEEGAGAWALHARGRLAASAPAPDSVDLEQWRKLCPQHVPAEQHHQRMASLGFQYGSSFRSMRDLWRGDDQVLARLELAGTDHEAYHCHPGLLDSAIQVMASVEDGSGDAEPQPYLPVGMRRFVVNEPWPSSLWVHCRVEETTDPEIRSAVLRLCNDEGRDLAIIDGLNLQRLSGEQGGDSERLESLLFEPRWLPSPLRPEEESDDRAGTWLVLADESGVGDALAEELGGRGHRVLRVSNREGDGLWVDPAQPDAFDTLLTEHQPADAPPLVGIAHLWNLDTPPLDALSSADLETILDTGCVAVVHLLQALMRYQQRRAFMALTQHQWHPTPRLWIATRACHEITAQGQPVSPASAAIWGLGRVVQQENTDGWTGLLDLDPALSPATAGALLADEWARTEQPTEELVAYVGEERHVLRLERALSAPKTPAPIDPGGSYLITGGFGGLGQVCARWLVEHGARRLLLLARTPLPPRETWSELPDDDPGAPKVRFVRELEALGASVQDVAIDVGDEAQMSQFFARYGAEARPPIRGIFHAAGVVEDRLLVSTDRATMMRIWRAKVFGALHLHRLTQDQPLDFFVGFSSMASTLGQMGSGAYAAGNAFLDAMIQARAEQQQGLSIGWGPWEGVGMADDETLMAQFVAQGLPPLKTHTGVAVLERLLATDTSYHMVFAIDWPTWKKQAAWVPALVSGFLRQATPSGAASDFRQSLLKAKPEARLGMVSDLLKNLVAQVLHLDPLRIDPAQSIRNLGADSIIMIEIQQHLKEALDASPSIVEIFGSPDLAHLAEIVWSRVEPTLEAAAEDQESEPE